MDWFYFAAQIASVVLLGRFAMAFARRSSDVYRRTLTGTAVLMPPAAAVAIWAGRSQMARAVMYPWLLTLVPPALWILWQRARQQPSRAEWGLLGGLTLTLGAGLHDYAYQQGFTSVMDTYWMPYAIPAALCGFSVVLVQRLVRALEGIEKLNLKLEQRVIERTRQLRAANRAKTRFLAFASHDLRQPMVSIGLLVALLRQQLQAPTHLRLVQRLHDATASMETLLKRLLDFSRLESGAVQVRHQAVPLQRLFDAVAIHHDEQARDKGLRLVMRPTACVIDTDPLLLEQILRNLVGNAVRHTERGGVLVGVRRGPTGRVRLQVWDTGVGIPAEQQQAIFEAFVQLPLDGGHLHPLPDPTGGVGLGLAIVQRCAALLEVPVTLRSRRGRGTCFSVALPASTD